MTLLMTWVTLNNSLRRKRSRWSSIKSPNTKKKNKKCSRLPTMIMVRKKSKQNNPRTQKATVKNRPMAKSKLMVKKSKLMVKKSLLYTRKLRTSVKKENWNRLRVRKLRKNKNSTLITTAMEIQMR